MNLFHIGNPWFLLRCFYYFSADLLAADADLFFSEICEHHMILRYNCVESFYSLIYVPTFLSVVQLNCIQDKGSVFRRRIRLTVERNVNLYLFLQKNLCIKVLVFVSHIHYNHMQNHGWSRVWRVSWWVRRSSTTLHNPSANI